MTDPRTQNVGPDLTPDVQPDFANDLLRGAEAIAEFLYGSRELRRNIYHLVATSNLPVFKLGSMICARKSALLKFVADQEARHTATKRVGTN
jgi:hypothetical protein